jgi:hypothetical protein
VATLDRVGSVDGVQNIRISRLPIPANVIATKTSAAAAVSNTTRSTKKQQITVTVIVIVAMHNIFQSTAGDRNYRRG